MDAAGFRSLFIEKKGILTEEDEAFLANLSVKQMAQIWDMIKDEKDWEAEILTMKGLQRVEQCEDKATQQDALEVASPNNMKSDEVQEEAVQSQLENNSQEAADAIVKATVAVSTEGAGDNDDHKHPLDEADLASGASSLEELQTKESEVQEVEHCVQTEVMQQIEEATAQQQPNESDEEAKVAVHQAVEEQVQQEVEERDAIISECQQKDQEMENQTQASEEPTLAVEEPATAAEEVMGAADEPMAEADEPVAAADEPVVAAEESIVNMEEAVSSTTAAAPQAEPMAAMSESSRKRRMPLHETPSAKRKRGSPTMAESVLKYQRRTPPRFRTIPQAHSAAATGTPMATRATLRHTQMKTAKPAPKPVAKKPAAPAAATSKPQKPAPKAVARTPRPMTPLSRTMPKPFALNTERRASLMSTMAPPPPPTTQPKKPMVQPIVRKPSMSANTIPRKPIVAQPFRLSVSNRSPSITTKVEAPTFKATPLNKKMFASVGESGVPRVAKKEKTVPQEFNFVKRYLEKQKQKSAAPRETEDSVQNKENVAKSDVSGTPGPQSALKRRLSADCKDSTPKRQRPSMPLSSKAQ